MGIGVYRLMVTNLSTQYNVVFNFYEAWRKILHVAFEVSPLCGDSRKQACKLDVI